jgi:hypothetical protein
VSGDAVHVLVDAGLISSNKKFPGATYWLTEAGKAMTTRPAFALIPSPLVGPLSWQPVAQTLAQRGHSVVVANPADETASASPFWAQHAQTAARAITSAACVGPLILVAHSGAGPLLPAIAARLGRKPAAFIFADAGILGQTASRLDLMRGESASRAAAFEEYLNSGGLFPAWSDADLQDEIPDEDMRRRMVSELRPRGKDFFTEPIPFLADGLPARQGYIQFSAGYESCAQHALAQSWPLVRFNAGHFYMLAHPQLVAKTLQEMANKWQVESGK